MLEIKTTAAAKMANIDRIDKKILEQLQHNAQLSNLELADLVGLSATPCARRVKRLHEDGHIIGSQVILDKASLGLNLTVLISITMDRHTSDRFENFERTIQTLPEIIECNIVTGQSADYLLKAVLVDMAHYEKFLLGKLTKIEGVTGVHSSFVLREVKVDKALPLDQLAN